MFSAKMVKTLDTTTEQMLWQLRNIEVTLYVPPQ